MKLSLQQIYVDEDTGATIYEWYHAPHAGLAESTFFAMVNHILSTSDGRQMPDQFRVDIKARSIDEAFEKLPGLLQGAREKRIAQLNHQQKMLAKSIVMPNGKPIVTGKPKTRIA